MAHPMACAGTSTSTPIRTAGRQFESSTRTSTVSWYSYLCTSTALMLTIIIVFVLALWNVTSTRPPRLTALQFAVAICDKIWG
eukprot:scaffold109553_cov45-Prasinocladus_malaysianus.AAC.3